MQVTPQSSRDWGRAPHVICRLSTYDELAIVSRLSMEHRVRLHPLGFVGHIPGREARGGGPIPTLSPNIHMCINMPGVLVATFSRTTLRAVVEAPVDIRNTSPYRIPGVSP